MVIEAPGRPATALDDGTIAKFKQSLTGDVIAPNDLGTIRSVASRITTSMVDRHSSQCA